MKYRCKSLPHLRKMTQEELRFENKRIFKFLDKVNKYQQLVVKLIKGEL